MDHTSPAAHRLPIVLLVALVVTGLAAAAFYGWMKYGSTMLLTLEETGLSGCV